MKDIQKIFVLFISMTWSMNVAAFDIDGISYDILSESDKTACVARQIETDKLVGDVRIASKVSHKGKEYTVTEISGWAFSDCRQMTSIAIPSTVQTIGYSAFWGCYGLTAVHIEDIAVWCSVTQKKGTEGNPLTLAHHLYVNGEEVTELVIPDGVTTIGDDAFHDATALTSVAIPSSVKTIGAEAFAGCNMLSNLSMAEGLQVIGFNAFGGCWSLKEVTVPEGTERLENDAFYHRDQLTTVHLPQ